MFDGSCLITLLKFLKNIRIGFKEAYVSRGTALVTFGRLVTKEPVACIRSTFQGTSG